MIPFLATSWSQYIFLSFHQLILFLNLVQVRLYWQKEPLYHQMRHAFKLLGWTPFFTVRNDLWRCDEAGRLQLETTSSRKGGLLAVSLNQSTCTPKGEAFKKERRIIPLARNQTLFLFLPACLLKLTSLNLLQRWKPLPSLWSLASGGLSARKHRPTDWPNFLPARCPNFLVVRALPGIEELVARGTRNAATFTSRNPGFDYSISGLRFMG